MIEYLLLNDENATIVDGKLKKYKGDSVHIRIPDDVHTILATAFSAKMKIQTLFLGKSVKKFNRGNSFFEAFEVDAENPYFTAIDGVLFDKNGEVLLNYPKGKKDLFYQVPEHVKEIGSLAFDGNPYLNEVDIPNTVSQIGYSAFWECCNLEKVNLPQTLEIIEDRLFSGANLQKVEIPPSVVQIKEHAFARNKNLQHVVLHQGLKEIGNNAFYECESLASIDLPGSLNKIESYTFAHNKSLQHVVLHQGIKEIGDHAFYECESLASIDFPDSLTKIETYAFCNTGLTSIVLSNSLTYFGKYSFGDCNTLTEVQLPKSLEVVHKYAFWGSEQLRLMLPRELKYEFTTLFYGCGEPIYAEHFMEDEDEDEEEETEEVSEELAAVEGMIKQLEAVMQAYDDMYSMIPEQQKTNAKIITEHRKQQQASLVGIDQELSKLRSELRVYKENLNECGFALWGEKARKRKHFASLVDETQNKLQQCSNKRTNAMLNLHKIPTRPIAQYTSAGHYIKLYPTNQLDATFAIEYDGELLIYNACEISLADTNVDARVDASQVDKAIMTGIAAGSFAGYLATSAAQAYGCVNEISLTLFNSEDSKYKKLVFASNAKFTSQEYSRFSADYDQFAGKFGQMMVNIDSDEVGAHNLIKNGFFANE